MRRKNDEFIHDSSNADFCREVSPQNSPQTQEEWSILDTLYRTPYTFRTVRMNERVRNWSNAMARMWDCMNFRVPWSKIVWEERKELVCTFASPSLAAWKKVRNLVVNYHLTASSFWHLFPSLRSSPFPQITIGKNPPRLPRWCSHLWHEKW